MNFYWLILGVLSVWRITHFLQAEDGPWDIVIKLRKGVGSGFFGKLFDCFHCLSLWIAVPAAWLIGQGWKEWIFLWLALSGGAILLEEISRREVPRQKAMYYEDKEDEHVLLWKSEDQVPHK
jgi:hypothetical protein